MNRPDFTQAATYIKQHCKNFTPKVGLILGSGLGDIAKLIENPIIISYDKLPGFPKCSVEGHGGQLYLGNLQGLPVACLQGRAHLYEGITRDVIFTLIRTLKLIGCEILLITNSAGSLRIDVHPGDLMLIADHINFQFSNVLAGPNDEEFGPRFLSMEDAYDPELRQKLMTVSKKLNINLAQGVYISVLGPSFETPAEIRAFRILGADAVGMSTVPEVIAARHCGLKVVAISAITNMGAGMSDVKLSHDVTLKGAKLAHEKLSQLILAFIQDQSRDYPRK